LENFSFSIIKTIEGERDRYFIDMPGKIIVNQPYIYFTDLEANANLYTSCVEILGLAPNDRADRRTEFIQNGG
jgi:hypothetical protein